jgi:Ala-tRNA(Pro) deacylase
LLALTGLVPGAVPPFGEPVLPLPLTADHEVGTLHPRVAFNAGSREHSVILDALAWRTLARPTFAALTEPAG